MDDEVTWEREGVTYSASYVVVGDELIVYLPDGSQRETTLNGMYPESTARNHLRGYVNALFRKSE
ncbi:MULTISPECIES: hypothetical protein [Pseudomonas]|uniref:hypothetical protein n=1 Tax=Pseudomonas TaxID=286 RepID=UPI00049AF359|nr:MULTISPECIES: hypothetical protein [Pseudomonas]AHZ80022.1 hypothetical protein DW66_5526 [Pseudomonas putida]AHZ80142.1 hypothetical protein DW66_5646 [Pseudomonas putida]QUN67608.1 hypothetical protein KDB76_27930 [Pseudomonas sp. JS425]CAB5521234.1 Uncharacterised protein [Pseudomonas putida]CAB5542029.1 Uncharacterised protein [Pseudomonas putida]